MNKELMENLKYLRLGGLLAHWDEHLKLAAESNWSHTRLLSRQSSNDMVRRTKAGVDIIFGPNDSTKHDFLELVGIQIFRVNGADGG